MEKQVKQVKEKITPTKYKLLFEWESPIRLYRPHSRQDYVMLVFVSLSILAFLFIIRQYVLIAGVLATVFLIAVLWSVKPENVKHKITSVGVFSIDKLYEWELLKDYWFTNYDGVYMLNVSTNLTFPARLISLAGDKHDVDKIHSYLQEYLKYKNIDKQSNISKRLDGLYVPLKDVFATKGKTLIDHSIFKKEDKKS